MRCLTARFIFLPLVVAAQLLATPVMSRESGSMSGMRPWNDVAGHADCVVAECQHAAAGTLSACSFACSGAVAMAFRADVHTLEPKEAESAPAPGKWTSWLHGPDPLPPKPSR